MATTTARRTVQDVDPKTLSDWLATGQALVVDVRPSEMFAAERIPGALSLPLPALGRSTLPDLGSRKLVFQCEVGMASEKAGRKLLQEGWAGDVYHMPGGLRAWKRRRARRHAEPGRGRPQPAAPGPDRRGLSRGPRRGARRRGLALVPPALGLHRGRSGVLRRQRDLRDGRRSRAPAPQSAQPQRLDHRRGPRRPPPSLPQGPVAPAKPALERRLL